MNKGNQTTYLSELFLEVLNGDFSRKAVYNALERCNEELLKRMEDSELIVKRAWYFVNKTRKKERERLKTKYHQEVTDFWDVCREFEEMITSQMKEKYLLLQIV